MYFLPTRVTAAITIGILLSSGVQADPPPSDLQVAVWAASCMACHGTDGRAGSAGLAIAGQPAPVLLTALRAFRDGQRPATVMHQHAKGYTDDQLARLADYFARQSAKAPR